MLTLILFLLAFVCWGIAIIIRKDPVAATPVVFLGITYFVIAAIILVLVT